MHALEDAIRTAEINDLRPWFAGATRVLELGAGGGLQARVMQSWGLSVAAVDLPHRERAAADFCVVEYDGVNLPFPDSTFDVVHSSSVLEHVVDALGLLREVARVSKPSAVSLHTVPTPVWRGWTTVTHPADPWKHLAGRLRSARGDRRHAAFGAATTDPLRKRIPRLIVAPVHGEYPSLRAEMQAYREQSWRDVFAHGGFTVERILPNGIFHTGVGVMPFLSIPARRHMARALGSPVATFVCRALTRA